MATSHAGRDATPADSAPRALLLAQLIRQHSSSLGALVQRLGVASADVDDVKQRVWLTASRWSTRLQPGRERAFLFAVARREASHALRTYRRRAEVGDIELDALQSGAPSADDIVSRRERVGQARVVLAAMDSGLRELFVALESGESTASAEARRLGIPLGTAKSRWRRARQECSRCAVRLTIR